MKKRFKVILWHSIFKKDLCHLDEIEKDFQEYETLGDIIAFNLNNWLRFFCTEKRRKECEEKDYCVLGDNDCVTRFKNCKKFVLTMVNKK